MPSQFFYRNDGKKVGPISASDIRQLAATGTITPDTPIRKGNSPWIAAKNVGGLSFAVKPNPAIASPFTETITDLPSAVLASEPEAQEPAETEPLTFDGFEPAAEAEAAPASEPLDFEPTFERPAVPSRKSKIGIGKPPSLKAPKPVRRFRALRWLAWLLIAVGTYCFIHSVVDLGRMVAVTLETNAAAPKGQAEAAELSRSIRTTTLGAMAQIYFAAALNCVALGGFMILLLEIEEHLRKQLPPAATEPAQ